MAQTRFFALLMALCCLFGTLGTAAASEVDCDSVYCFSPEDFSQESSITGICITGLPEGTGAVMLGSRILQPGDILTAGQVAQMTFSPVRTEYDRTAEVSYLPIYGDRVAGEAVLTIGIRGKEDKAPVAEDSAMETYKNLPSTGKLKVSDPEGESLTYTLVRQPRRGTVEIGEDGSFTYTPKKNKVGVDSFVFTATDPAGKVSREATVTVTILKPTDATQYTDTVGRECRFAAEWMKHTGIFVGEQVAENACFSPDRQVTRGEFVTMLVRALEIPVDETQVFTGYTDEIPGWLQPYLAAAMRSGLTAGLPQQEVFGADTVITGAEVAVLLQNALNLSAGGVAVTEDSTVPAWAAASMTVLQQHDFLLEADAPLTRGDAAMILYQAVRVTDNDLKDEIL